MSTRVNDMTWNYRVIKRSTPHPYKSETDYVTFTVHEVYYDSNGTIMLWDPEPTGASPHGETLEETKESYELIGKAFNAPTLEWEDMPSAPTERNQEITQPRVVLLGRPPYKE